MNRSSFVSIANIIRTTNEEPVFLLDADGMVLDVVEPGRDLGQALADAYTTTINPDDDPFADTMTTEELIDALDEQLTIRPFDGARDGWFTGEADAYPGLAPNAHGIGPDEPAGDNPFYTGEADECPCPECQAEHLPRQVRSFEETFSANDCLTAERERAARQAQAQAQSDHEWKSYEPPAKSIADLIDEAMAEDLKRRAAVPWPKAHRYGAGPYQGYTPVDDGLTPSKWERFMTRAEANAWARANGFEWDNDLDIWFDPKKGIPPIGGDAPLVLTPFQAAAFGDRVPNHIVQQPIPTGDAFERVLIRADEAAAAESKRRTEAFKRKWAEREAWVSLSHWGMFPRW